MQTQCGIALAEVVNGSESLEILREIAETMEGGTMHHHTHLLYDLRTLLGSEEKTYTEIGTFNGASASLMLRHPYATTVHCIDPLHLHPSQKRAVEANVAKFNTMNRSVTIHCQYSSDFAFLQQLKREGFKTDILFIDGDHSYEAVLNDFYGYADFVNVGGFVVFDDYEDYVYSPDVRKAVDDIIASGDASEFQVIGNLANLRGAYDCLGLERSNLFVLQKVGMRRGVKWVPAKRVDMGVVMDKLECCAAACQFANNGRFVRALEAQVAGVLDIDCGERAVVAVCNGACALSAAVGGLAMHCGRQLRWATQAFTFPCAHQGVLKDSLVVDVAAAAMGPCLVALERAVGEFDGVIVTNCFGLAVDMEAYVEFCRRHDKLLVFDNAATPLTRYQGRNVNNYGDACIVSLHHTKPIGFGEGGVVVFRKRYQDAMTRVICFGHSDVDKYHYSVHASNYKMSEISAIFVSGWLERVGDIRAHSKELLAYFVDEMRRRDVARARVYPNFAEQGDTVAAVIPILFDRPCSVDAFIREGVDAKKYYYPISEAPAALDLFERIVCLPLHLDVSRRDIQKYVAIIFAEAELKAER